MERKVRHSYRVGTYSQIKGDSSDLELCVTSIEGPYHARIVGITVSVFDDRRMTTLRHTDAPYSLTDNLAVRIADIQRSHRGKNVFLEYTVSPPPDFFIRSPHRRS